MQLRYTPASVAYLDANGCVLAQNTYSYSCVGAHGLHHHLPGWADEHDETLHRYLDHLFDGKQVIALLMLAFTHP